MCHNNSCCVFAYQIIIMNLFNWPWEKRVCFPFLVYANDLYSDMMTSQCGSLCVFVCYFSWYFATSFFFGAPHFGVNRTRYKYRSAITVHTMILRNSSASRFKCLFLNARRLDFDPLFYVRYKIQSSRSVLKVTFGGMVQIEIHRLAIFMRNFQFFLLCDFYYLHIRINNRKIVYKIRNAYFFSSERLKYRWTVWNRFCLFNGSIRHGA